ncbi:LCP family protein [Streptomyces sp. NPDC026659]|uniref:LCP family protein n=1 Tax=Streptomyces sp. NPDC026659 TaxID=3155123 RepID=UPI0033F587DA
MTANSLRAEEFATGLADRPGEDAKSTGKGAGRPRRGRRILKWSAATLAMLVIGTAGAGFVYYEHLNGNIKKARLNLGDAPVPQATPNAAGQTPLNILLIGSDSRNTASDLKLGGSKGDVGRPPLGDVQMLLHLSADRSNMSVISLPRDTMIPIPKCTDPDTGKVYPALSLSMANESLGRGGPGCTVATWTELTGVHIDHFMMVDFSGVVSMADAIGGVPVCVKDNVYSHTADGHGSGLKLEKGTHPVKGQQALQWLRTRYGFEDGTDIGRTHAQHMYINSMVRQLRANARLGNPTEMRELAEAATDALTVDDGLGTVKKLYDLSMELQKVPTDGITMTTLPTVQWAQDHNRLVPAPGDAEQLISMVRDDDALTGLAGKKPTPAATSTDPAALPADIAVQVRNGTGTAMEAPAPQRASAVTKLLQNQGFSGASADTTPATEPDTEVLYPGPDQEGDAQAVADALHIPLKRARQSDDVQGVTLVVGADWRTGDTFPKPKPKKVPESAAVLNGEKADACMDIQQGFTW